MRGLGVRTVVTGALCAAALALGAAAAPALGATSEPLFVYSPEPPPPPASPIPPPTGYLSGPCGLAVDSNGKLYVSDYYHDLVDVFKPTVPWPPEKAGEPPVQYETQLVEENVNDGPCGLAFDSSNRLYVNNYHRNVVRFNASPSFGTGSVFPLPAQETAYHLPTGVAVDSVTGNVYVDNRTYVSVYDSAGNPIMEGANPLRIGVGTLGDGYGLAFSTFAGTFGRLYVPDAASNTIKVYDPSIDKVNPVAEIKDPFNHPFVSLHDSAIAVDRVTGDVYFADDTQPKYTEKPQATIYIYGSTGTYKGHLKYNVTDALQPGIAVDNSAGVTQGRVYITSGNTNQAGVYAYGPGSGTFGNPLPPTFAVTVSSVGSGSGSVDSAAAKLDCSDSCERELLAGGTDILTAIPDPGSEFSGWSGACAGSDPTCTVTLDEAASVSASFTDASPEAGPSQQAGSPPDVQASAQAQARPRHRARHRHLRRHGRRHHVKHRH